MGKIFEKHFTKEDMETTNKHIKNVLKIISHKINANLNYDMATTHPLRQITFKKN